MIKITKEMEQYINLQRTNIKSNFAERYETSLYQDYNDIKDYLPLTCKRILDIGCGLAGIDLLLYNHYLEKPELHLFDYNSISKEVYYGYQKVASHYNSLKLAGEFLKLNGVDKKQIGLHEIYMGFPFKNYDIIISLISYGFHYPLETYWYYFEKYQDHKCKILDIRKDTNQIKMLKDNFETVKIINEYQKYFRILVK